MEYQRFDQPDDNFMALDEGWWESVLSEDTENDDLYTPEGDIETKKPKRGLEMANVDWDLAMELYSRDEIVTLSVEGFNRGGLLVEGDHIKGFVPLSHLIETKNPEINGEIDLSNYLGNKLKLKIIECESSLDRIVLSERAALSKEGQRNIIFKTIKQGDTVEGTVTNITDFGVFVDLGGVEGLVHVSELSWGRVQHPSDIIAVGEDVHAQVLKVCEDTGRVAMSIKQLQPNPWMTISETYQPGDIVTSVVTSISHFGVFARLEEGIEGLIHISSISVTNDHNKLHSHFHPGQILKTRILHIDPTRRRLGLAIADQKNKYDGTA